MIILDTNVISALIQAVPDPMVRAWANQQRRDALVTTTVTVMELRAGIEHLLESKRRRQLDADVSWALDDLLGGRVLNFDRLRTQQLRGMHTAGAWGVLFQLRMSRSLASPYLAGYRL